MDTITIDGEPALTRLEATLFTRRHVMQCGDRGPDWCIHCGTFDVYCVGECDGPRTGSFDSRTAQFMQRPVVQSGLKKLDELEVGQ